MPIEFTCPGCQKLLRVAATAAGKEARCPDCNKVSRVPFSASASPSAGDFPGVSLPAPKGSAEEPWSTSNWTASPTSLSSDAAANPFSSPESGLNSLLSLSLEQEARNQVAAPAICLIVTGSIVFGLTAIWVAMVLFAAIIDVIRMAPQRPGEAVFSLLITLGISAFALGRPGLIIYGGIQMRQLRRYPFAIAAGVLAIISFCSCFVELAFGIWALIVLSRTHVKQAFNEQKQPTIDYDPF